MQHAFQRSVVFVLFLFILALSACQRAPQAYFAPSPRPAHPAGVLTETSPPPSVSETDLTASVTDVPMVSAKPAWDLPAEPTVEPAIVTDVRKPTLWQRYKRMLPRKPAPPQCDQIVLRNGDVVDAKVKEVGVNEIRYKKCDRPDGPDYTISKRDVLSIKYSNGEVERFSSSAGSTYNNNSSSGNQSSYNSPTNPQNDGPRTDPFAIVAVAAGGLAIFTGLGSLLLGAAAVVFGALSLSRIRREPNRFKGKGLAVAGMVAGIVAASLILLYVYVL